jgi:hypothetical protein
MPTIFVALLDEGVDVWRPVNAELLADGARMGSGIITASSHSLAADGAIACFSSNFFPSA